MIWLFLIFGISSSAKDNQEKISEALSLIQAATSILNGVKESMELQDQAVLDESTYKEALKKLQNRDFERARIMLLPFTKEKNDRSIHALYWIGYSFFEEGNFERAMVALSQFINRSKNIADYDSVIDIKKEAMKKIVKCFVVLRRPVDSCSVLKNLEAEFPSEAQYVKNLSDKLKCDVER